MKSFIFVFAVCAVIHFTTGCATVTRGTKQALVVESEPSGADVYLSTGPYGKTPTSFKVRRRHDFDVTIKKEGYETVKVHVTSQIANSGAAGMAGNIILGGLVGAAIDARSGGMKELAPNPIKVVLVKSTGTKVEPEPVEPIVNTEGKPIEELVKEEWQRVKTVTSP